MEERQSLRVPLSLAAVGIFGTLLGAVIPQYMTSQRASQAAFLDQQREAYVGFLNALDYDRMARQKRCAAAEKRSKASALKMRDREEAEKSAAQDAMKADELETKFEVEGGAALRRIAIYGDERVVSAIAEWSRQTTNLPVCGPHWKADLAVSRAMRDAALGRGRGLSGADLGELSLFCRPEAGR